MKQKNQGDGNSLRNKGEDGFQRKYPSPTGHSEYPSLQCSIYSSINSLN